MPHLGGNTMAAAPGAPISALPPAFSKPGPPLVRLGDEVKAPHVARVHELAEELGRSIDQLSAECAQLEVSLVSVLTPVPDVPESLEEAYLGEPPLYSSHAARLATLRTRVDDAVLCLRNVRDRLEV